MKIEFPPDHRIDNFCYELVSTLYPETGSGALLTNLSTLDDFEDGMDIPGHELRKLSEIPGSDRKNYLNDFKNLKRFLGSLTPDRLLVWYPPVSKEEWDEIGKQTRQRLIQRLEENYQVSFADYPEDQDLYIWQVAGYIARKRGEKLREES